MAVDLKLYTFRLCPFAHRVRLTLAEKRLDAELVEINLKDKPADFLSISPNGRVPVLVHDGKRIWESAIIMEYLEEAFPEPPLMPTDASARADVRLWVDFANARLFESTHRLIFEQDPDRRRIYLQQLDAAVRQLENEGIGRRGRYLLGDRFTLADIALYPWFEQLATLEQFSGFRRPAECEGIRAWMAAVAVRPAVQRCAKSDEWYADNYRRYLPP